MMQTYIIDAKNLECPQPIIRTKKMLDSIKEGCVTTIVDNQTAVENLTAYAKSLAYETSVKDEGTLYYVTMIKTGSEETEVVPSAQDLVIQIASDKYGQGDDELGRSLMKAYIYALTEAEPRPAKLMFINSGVKLTTEGSTVLDSLKQLSEEGTEILSCGACLNFYGLTEKLEIGKVTNMYTMVENLHRAGSAIKI